MRTDIETLRNICKNIHEKFPESQLMELLEVINKSDANRADLMLVGAKALSKSKVDSHYPYFEMALTDSDTEEVEVLELSKLANSIAAICCYIAAGEEYWNYEKLENLINIITKLESVDGKLPSSCKIIAGYLCKQVWKEGETYMSRSL